MPQRNAGIVLNKHVALLQDKVARQGKVTAMGQVGGALEQAVGGAEALREGAKTAFLQTAIGEVGAEIIERLRFAALIGESDPDAR